MNYKLKKMRLDYIKSYKSAELNLVTTKVLVGQNDHGKSSLLKILNICLNEITAEMITEGILSPDIAEKLLTIFNTNAKARRITLIYEKDSKEQELYITVRVDLSFLIHDKIEKSAKTSTDSILEFEKIREFNSYILIPAIRDVSSKEFSNLFQLILEEHGLNSIIPTTRGGTTKEYRQLKKIKDDINTTITPYIESELLSAIKNIFPIDTAHPISIAFDMDVDTISKLIKDNIRLAFTLDQDDLTAKLSLGEAGTGVQSAVLLALQSLTIQAEKKPSVNFIFAIEEPEAFLHPQKQKELFANITDKRPSNLSYLITTHSPYIVNMTKFKEISLVRKNGQFSEIYSPNKISEKDSEIFSSLSDDLNSQVFFSDKVILVEGESDKRVIESLLRKKYGSKGYRFSIISVGGNRNFSPYIKMLEAWNGFSFPYLIVTDFDSLTKSSERAIFRGMKDAGHKLTNETELYSLVDKNIEKSESEYEIVKKTFIDSAKQVGVNIFVFNSDLEYSLINDKNKEDAISIMNELNSNTSEYSGYTLSQLKGVIGSKGIPLNLSNGDYKKPFIHKKIAETIFLDYAHSDIKDLMIAIENI